MHHRQCNGVRVIDVKGLGYDAAFVEMEDETLLLVEMSLSRDQRMAVLSSAMSQASA